MAPRRPPAAFCIYNLGQSGCLRTTQSSGSLLCVSKTLKSEWRKNILAIKSHVSLFIPVRHIPTQSWLPRHWSPTFCISIWILCATHSKRHHRAVLEGSPRHTEKKIQRTFDTWDSHKKGPSHLGQFSCQGDKCWLGQHSLHIWLKRGLKVSCVEYKLCTWKHLLQQGKLRCHESCCFYEHMCYMFVVLPIAQDLHNVPQQYFVLCFWYVIAVEQIVNMHQCPWLRQHTGIGCSCHYLAKERRAAARCHVDESQFSVRGGRPNISCQLVEWRVWH